MRGTRKFCQRGPTLIVFFCLFFRGATLKRPPKRAIIGLPAKRHWNSVSLACRSWPTIECWLGSFVIFRGSGPVLLGNPINLWFFRGGGGQDPMSPLWILTWFLYHNSKIDGFKNHYNLVPQLNERPSINSNALYHTHLGPDLLAQWYTYVLINFKYRSMPTCGQPTL